ncbi:MAG: efflux RND transporter periplasmic adaptor subunit [Candidatus Binatia bacterium]
MSRFWDVRLDSWSQRSGILLSLLSVLIVAGCQSSSSEVEAANDVAAAKSAADHGTSAEPQRVAVKIAKPVSRKVQRTARGQGALFANETVIIATKLPGYVSEVNVDFGDRVRIGQVLVEIEREELGLLVDSAESALKQAQANYIRAKGDYERAQQLFVEELIPPQRRDAAEADYKVAEAAVHSAEKALALAQKRLRDTHITSPLNGFVQERFSNPGEYVAAGAKLLEVVDVNPLKLRTPIPERYARLARIGLPIQIEVDALPGETFTGKLTRVAAGVEHSSRSLLVEAEIPNPDSRLRPGYFAHVTGVMGEERALFIPRTGVYRYAGVERIFVVSENQVTSREVKTGVQEGDLIEIAEGVSADDHVAISALDRLADGVVVQAQMTEVQ